MAEIKDPAYIQYLPLYKAVDNGDLEATLKFLEEHPDGLTASISADGDTALHVAVLAGHREIVVELVGRLGQVELEIRNSKNASTALHYAAIGGITRIAEDLVEKNGGLLTVPNQNGHIPVVVASLYGHKDMVRYLYSVSPKEELSPATNNKNGVMLLTTCIMDELYGIRRAQSKKKRSVDRIFAFSSCSPENSILFSRCSLFLSHCLMLIQILPWICSNITHNWLLIKIVTKTQLLICLLKNLQLFPVELNLLGGNNGYTTVCNCFHSIYK